MSTAAPRYAYPIPSLPKESVQNLASLLKIISLVLISAAAIASRLFAVVNFESIIHEFDPWFNYRATKVLAEKGFYEFWNWFDPTAWYPLGRVVGGTVYPGLMATSGLIWSVLRAVNLPVDIRNVCVLLAPGFSALTAWATYMFTSQIHTQQAGLLAAMFIGITPGYISRSVAGSYDNEAIAIFLLMITFYLWIKALHDGSALYGSLCGLTYFYMVAAWGGYAFITNMIPVHALTLMLMGRFSPRMYTAYSTWYAIGTLSSMQVPFVGFQPVRTSEHMGALGVFGLLQIVAFAYFVRSLSSSSKQFEQLLKVGLVAIGLIGGGAFVTLTIAGYIAPWTGRFYSLWDTGYAKKYIPIIASVSEHQPTAWPSFFMDLHFLIFLLPAGIILCFYDGKNGSGLNLNEGAVFLIIYAVVGSYFAGVMVRLMLTLTPCVCVCAAIAVSTLLDTYLDPHVPPTAEDDEPAVEAVTVEPATPVGKKSKALPKPPVTPVSKSTSSSPSWGIYSLPPRILIVVQTLALLIFFVHHSTYVTSSAYSSPSVVLASRNTDGSQNIIDDFREAYYWLQMNTKETDVVASWWDYGYQIAGMSRRPTMVDNNTWNNTHIATVGKAMASPEEVAYPILTSHDVSYVLVIFGGLIGYSGDDINKFLWMIRIAQGIWPDEVTEASFFTPRGEYKVDEGASATMKNSLMYKMSYYRFTDLFGGQRAQDRVRNQVITENPRLDYLEEAFTSENWIVRIYKVKSEDILGRDHRTAGAFLEGKKGKRGKPLSRRKAIV